MQLTKQDTTVNFSVFPRSRRIVSFMSSIILFLLLRSIARIDLGLSQDKVRKLTRINSVLTWSEDKRRPRPWLSVRRPLACRVAAASRVSRSSRSELLRQRRDLGKFRQNVARFRLYRHRSLQLNTRFSAFFEIYKIIQLKFLNFGKILQILRHLQNFG